MSLIGNVDTPASYVADYMQACVGMLGIPAGGFTADIEAFGATNDYNVESLYAAMLNSSIGRSIYAPGSSNATFAAKLVEKLGGSLLSDDAEAWALDWAETQLDNGMSRAALAMEAVESISAVDTADENFGTLAQQFANRIEIANYYTFSTTNPSSTPSTLTSILAAVTNTTDVSDPADVIADSAGGVVTGDSFTLTTGVDAATGKNTVIGILSDTASERTWSLTDQVSGSTATTDNLSVTIIGDANGTSYSGMQTSGFETVNVTYVDGADAADANTFGTSGLTGMTKLVVKNSAVVNTTATTDDSLTLSSVAKGVALELANNSLQLNVTANYVTAATEGTADTVSISAAGGSTGDVIIGTGFETVAVATSAAASKFQSLQAGAAKTINVTGDQGLTITDNLSTSNASLTTFDASGNSGAVSVTVTGASTLTAKGGSGTADAATISLGSSVSTGMAVSGFETVNLQATATSSVTGSLITGATATNVKGSTTNISAATLTMNEFAAGTGINIVGTGKNEAQYVNAVTLVQTGASTGTADSVAIKLSNGGVAVATTNTVTAGLITAANIETVTLDVADFGKVDGSLTIANANSLTLTGSAILDLATFTGNATLTTIDASAYTGKLTLGTLTDVTGSLTFKGSTGIDSLTNAQVAATKTATFNLGAGADTMTINVASADANATLTVNGDAGDDVFTVSAAADSVGTNTINGGADTDTLKITGTGDTKTISATISGIEKINLEAGTATTTLNLTVATGFADTVTVTDVSGQTQTIKLNVASGGSVSGANLQFLGWTDGMDVLQYVSGAGNETFTMGATNSGTGFTETYVVAATNGIDTISGFTPAANEDVINATALAAFIGTTTETVLNVTATNTTGAGNDNILLLNYGTYYADAAAVVAGASAYGLGSNITGAAAHVLIAYQTAASSAVRIAEATIADAGGITAATDLVVLTGVTTITDLVASNFVLD